METYKGYEIFVDAAYYDMVCVRKQGSRDFYETIHVSTMEHARKKVDEIIECENKCCICKNELIGYGNNPDPVKDFGRCCDDCNASEVVPARLTLMFQENTENMKRVCKRCNRATGPDLHSGCDQADQKDCAWYVEKFNKNHQDEMNKENPNRIKNNIEDGENISGI